MTLTIGPSILGQLPPDDLPHRGGTVAFVLGNRLQTFHINFATILHALEARADVLSVSQLANVETKSGQDGEEGRGGTRDPVGQHCVPAMYGT